MSKKYKAFNLVEILLTMTIIGVIAVGLLPVLTKRAKTQKSFDPDCLNGFKMEQKIYSYIGGDQTFRVPDNIAGPVTFTLIGGGSGGNPGSYNKLNGTATFKLNEASPKCSVSKLKNSSSYFYSNFRLDIILKGGPADCTGSPARAGKSGVYIPNFIVATQRGTGKIFECGPDASGESIVCDGISTFAGLESYIQSNLGMSYDSSSNFLPKKLGGGVPSVRVTYQDKENDPYKYAGVGQGCFWDEAEGKYAPDGEPTDGVCRVIYNRAIQGNGGSSGAYGQFQRAFGGGDSCIITVGHGGESGTEGEATSVRCGNNTYITSSDVGFDLYIEPASGKGKPSDGAISGCSGGDIIVNNKINSSGAFGGCYNSYSSANCANPDGLNGTEGSGGGGGSCSDDRCGVGGRGGDGVVVVKYKVQCE